MVRGEGGIWKGGTKLRYNSPHGQKPTGFPLGPLSPVQLPTQPRPLCGNQASPIHRLQTSTQRFPPPLRFPYSTPPTLQPTHQVGLPGHILHAAVELGALVHEVAARVAAYRHGQHHADLLLVVHGALAARHLRRIKVLQVEQGCGQGLVLGLKVSLSMLGGLDVLNPGCRADWVCRVALGGRTVGEVAVGLWHLVGCLVWASELDIRAFQSAGGYHGHRAAVTPGGRDCATMRMFDPPAHMDAWRVVWAHKDALGSWRLPPGARIDTKSSHSTRTGSSQDSPITTPCLSPSTVSVHPSAHGCMAAGWDAMVHVHLLIPIHASRPPCLSFSTPPAMCPHPPADSTC